jgi:hypothetical protein
VLPRVHLAAAGAWDDVEIAATQLPAVTVQQLIEQNPDHVIQFIAKKGVVKLGEFKMKVNRGEAEHTTLNHFSCKLSCKRFPQRFSTLVLQRLSSAVNVAAAG